MKKNWEVKTINELSTLFADGDWIESKDQSIEGIRLIQTGNVGNGFFKERGEKARYISEETFKRLRCTEIIEGDCLISRLPDPVGRACLLPNTNQKMITAVDCSIIRFNEKKMLPKWFINYSLSKEYFNKVQSEVTGSTRQRITRKNLGLIEIPLPPLQEQQRIVAILDEAFTAIDKAKANTEQNLKNAKELFESELQRVFSNPNWEEKMLKEIGNAQTGTTPKTAEKDNYGNYIPFIKPADVDYQNDGSIRYNNEGLTEKGVKSTRLMSKGSILMVCIGATIGKVGFVDRDVTSNQQINSLTVCKDFYPKFFYYALSTKNFYNSVIKSSAQATLPIINKGKWETLFVKFPKSLKDQQTIVSKLDALREQTKKLEAVYEKKLQDLEELKKSVLSKAFSGEL